MDPTFRILDANLNRAREGLRTAEEYARLALNDAASFELIKGIRRLLQEFAECEPGFGARLLAARHVEADVGLDPHAEDVQRAGLEDVACAGLKRAQEALRVIEEHAQLVVRHAAHLAARARHGAYILEQQLFTAAPRRKLLRESPVMVIFTRALCRGDWHETLRALLGAGARLFQLREKDATAADFSAFAADFCGLATGCAVIVNDRADVAAGVGADGVHVGQDDLPPGAARAVVGPGALVGVSTHNGQEAAAAFKAGADYIGLGAMFPTASKKVQSMATPETVRAVLQAVTGPVFCIGGVSPGNVVELHHLGVKQAAAGASILGAADPAAAFKALAGTLAGNV